MSTRTAISLLIASLAAAGLALGFTQPGEVPPALQAVSHAASQTTLHPLSDAEIHSRGQKLIANQHADDEALEEYERIEQRVDRTGGPNPHTITDKTYRLVPTGSGTFKLLVKDGNTPTDPVEYRKQLLLLEEALELALKPNDSKEKAAVAKWQKRKRDRAEMVDATPDAFLAKWVGSETVNGRACDVIELNPNPNFHPHTMLQEAVSRATAKIWVDHDSIQLVRAEAHVTRDIYFGGGILGKLYRGAVFWLEQAEVAPGLWLPTRYQYDFSGRKFLFLFEEHQYIEVGRYRRIGTPKQALAIVQGELAGGKAFNGDP